MNITTISKTHKLYNDYCIKYKHPPVAAEVDIVWKNDKTQHTATLIKFSKGDLEEFIENEKHSEFYDERIFYYVTSVNELCELLGKYRSREDFYVSRIYGFY